MAWTEIARRQYRREGLRCASGLSDAEWELLKPLMLPRPAAKAAETDLRAVANAIIHGIEQGTNGVGCPKNFSLYSFYGWAREGRFTSVNRTRVMCHSGDVSLCEQRRRRALNA